MGKLLAGIIATTLTVTPAHGQNWRSQAISTEPGAFVGARLRMPLGGDIKARRPKAALTIAPTVRSMSAAGEARTRIGEGLSLGLASDRQVSLTLAGVRTDQILGLARGPQASSDRKLGMSTAGWVAVGVGAAVLIGAAVFYQAATNCEDHDDEC